MIVQLPGIQPEIAMQAIPDDERVWVPQAPGVWFRPLLLNTVTGSWCNLLRVRKSRRAVAPHPSVVGHRLRDPRRVALPRARLGRARKASFVYEPPGEIHTLVVDEQVGATEMITFFNIHGAMVYVDDGRRGHRLRGRVHQDRDVPQALRRVRPRRGLRRPVRALTLVFRPSCWTSGRPRPCFWPICVHRERQLCGHGAFRQSATRQADGLLESPGPLHALAKDYRAARPHRLVVSVAWTIEQFVPFAWW